jgi:hypothetical protein
MTLTHSEKLMARETIKTAERLYQNFHREHESHLGIYIFTMTTTTPLCYANDSARLEDSPEHRSAASGNKVRTTKAFQPVWSS